MRYEGQIYRPPGEWRSYLLQCTIGCSHNKCTFCGMYKTKKFHVRPMKEIIEDIAMAREYYGPENVDKVFLCDGDAIVMRQAHLLQILEALYAAFPHLRQVTVYAGTRSTMTKSQEQLIELRQAGLTRAYLGVESGWDELLKKVNKGVTSEQMLQAAALLKNAGIDLWVTVILESPPRSTWRRPSGCSTGCRPTMSPACPTCRSPTPPCTRMSRRDVSR